jgi:ABC-type bacteriocin/lantibiotic exporter with double-glycine peptidase domain
MFNSLRLFWKLLAIDVLNERKRLILGFAFALISGFFVALIPYSIQLIIDRAIPLKSLTLLGRYSLLLLAVVIAGACLWYVQVSLIARASENIFRNFKLRLSESILRKHLSFFSRYQSSDLLTRMVTDLELVSEFFHKYLLKSLVLSVFTLVFLIYILILNPKLAMIALFGIPVLGIIMAALDKPITRTSAAARERLSDQNERVLDILQGHKEIRFFQQNQKMLAHAQSVFSNCAEANFKFLRTMGITEFLLETAGVLILFLPVVVGGYAICRGASGITIGLIVAFQTYLIILADGVNKISLGFAESIKATPSIGRLLEIRDYPVEEQTRAADWNDIPDTMAIEFKQVAFGYLKDKTILTHFDLRIDPAEKICIMGSSGSGKSTIANLLLRFLAPDAGEITLGGVDIRKYPLAAYLSHFSYVWQDTYLFKLSIKENVKLGWFEVPDAMIEKAIAQVGLKQTIESLPEQYETIVGRSGINFSGGQRQRLALARALIRGPEILILDEFTSALDSELEQKMLDDIFALFGRQTILCITHSWQVAKRFDRVVRLESPVAESYSAVALS